LTRTKKKPRRGSRNRESPDEETASNLKAGKGRWRNKDDGVGISNVFHRKINTREAN